MSKLLDWRRNLLCWNLNWMWKMKKPMPKQQRLKKAKSTRRKKKLKQNTKPISSLKKKEESKSWLLMH